MKQAVLILLILALGIGCTSKHQLKLAAREMKELGNDFVIYCWVREDWRNCRNSEARSDEKLCISELAEQNEYPMQDPGGALTDCMKSRGWNKQADLIVLF